MKQKINFSGGSRNIDKQSKEAKQLMKNISELQLKHSHTAKRKRSITQEKNRLIERNIRIKVLRKKLSESTEQICKNQPP